MDQTDNTDDGRDVRRAAATNKGPARAATRDARERESMREEYRKSLSRRGKGDRKGKGWWSKQDKGRGREGKIKEEKVIKGRRRKGRQY